MREQNSLSHFTRSVQQCVQLCICFDLSSYIPQLLVITFLTRKKCFHMQPGDSFLSTGLCLCCSTAINLLWEEILVLSLLSIQFSWRRFSIIQVFWKWSDGNWTSLLGQNLWLNFHWRHCCLSVSIMLYCKVRLIQCLCTLGFNWNLWGGRTLPSDTDGVGYGWGLQLVDFRPKWVRPTETVFIATNEISGNIKCGCCLF